MGHLRGRQSGHYCHPTTLVPYILIKPILNQDYGEPLNLSYSSPNIDIFNLRQS